MTARAPIAVLLALVLTVPNLAHASAQGSWDAVRQIQAGRRIRVVLASDGQPQHGIVVQGRFASAVEDHIVLQARDGSTRMFRREEVHQVRVRVAFMMRKGAWLVAGPLGGFFGATGIYLGGAAYGLYAGAFYFFIPYVLASRLGRTRPVYTAPAGLSGPQQSDAMPDGQPAVPGSVGESGSDDPDH